MGLQGGRWKLQVFEKHWYTYTKVRGITFCKTIILLPLEESFLGLHCTLSLSESLQGYYSVWGRHFIPLFWKNVLPSHSFALKMDASRSSKV